MNSEYGSPGWRVSLHGGHSGEFCDHGHGTLREAVAAAAAFGYHTFGVAEHAPRDEARFLYPEEIARGWDVAKVADDFARYAEAVHALAAEFAPRLQILCGFEAEMVPRRRYVEAMLRLRDKYAFHYMVGSVHWVGDIIIDYNAAEYRRAVGAHGGAEQLAVAYYEALAEMATALKPEVIGHFDVIRKYAAPDDTIDTPAVREAAGAALDAVKTAGAILDINTAPYRKGGDIPYPAPWLVERARDLRIPMCFGDDSHGPDDVGKGIREARDYLLALGVTEVTYLAREGNNLVQRLARLT